eukprot:PhF_6_TR40976/c0_g1_i1/m.62037
MPAPAFAYVAAKLGIVVATSVGIQWVAFVPAAIFQTEKFYDLTGSATFITLSAVSRFVLGGAEPNAVGTAATVMCSLWALRLGSFLFYRIHGEGKDSRFDKVRGKPKVFWVYWTIQGVWCFLSGLAVYTANVVGGPNSIGLMGGIGIGIWSVGMLIEVVSDVQKLLFKKDPANKGKFITTGLWSLSRHPNYFGEIMLWTGMAFLTASSAPAWWVYPLAFTSPAFTALLLIKVSGIPILERQADKRWGEEQEYIEYKKKTAVLVPYVW